jgi:spermidine synthase
MSTRRHHSEDELATRTCTPLADHAAPRVCIGGLGLGFTLRRALELLPSAATVVVVELVEAVLRWNAEPAYALAGDALRDPRVTVVHGDVHAVLDAPAEPFHAILLDVDNGADALVHRGNARLYDDRGLRRALAAVVPGGVVAYWSADRDESFARALRRVGARVDAVEVRARANKGARHMLYLARRPEAARDVSAARASDRPTIAPTSSRD